MSKMYKIASIVFVVIIFGFGIASIILPDKEFSERERRNLQQFPKLSIDFMEDFGKYVQDQFPLRDDWINLKSAGEALLAKKENNGLYYGANGYLMNGIKLNEEKFNSNLKYIKQFSDSFTGNVFFLPIPTSAGVYKEYLPKWAPVLDQNALINRVSELSGAKIIDPFEALTAAKDEYIYFKLDHHYTMRGAYAVYGAVANVMGLEQETDFEVRKLADDFYGTYYASAGGFLTNPDYIEAFYGKREHQVEISEEAPELEGVYSYSRLDTYDKYAVFLDGNHAYVKITTPSVKNGKKLLLIKDSYSHALAPFLANNFEEIHMVDPRYFKTNLHDFAKKNSIDTVLLNFGLSTLMEECGLSTLAIGS